MTRIPTSIDHEWRRVLNDEVHARPPDSLQTTVEGLSVAAVTYYVVGLIGTLAKGLPSTGVPMNHTLVTTVSIPIVAGLAFFGSHRLRAKISREAGE